MNIDESIRAHTIHSERGIRASDGLAHEYVDSIGMLLCQDEPCQGWDNWIRWRIADVQLRVPVPVTPVGRGQGGAVMLGILGRGVLLRAPYKQHGLPRHGRLPAVGSPIVLVDDFAITNETMSRLHQWAKDCGLAVVGEIIAVDRRPARG